MNLVTTKNNRLTNYGRRYQKLLTTRAVVQPRVYSWDPVSARISYSAHPSLRAWQA